MARVFKKRGEWWLDYRAGGKRRREPVGSSHALAKEVLAKRLAEVAEQKHFPGRVANARSFDEVAARFWELHGQHMLSASWGWMFAKVKTAFKGRKIGDVSTADVQRFYNEVAGKTTAATANRYLSLVRVLFNKAESWGDFHGKNPCAGVKKGREAAHRLRFLNREEMERLLKASHPRLRPVVICALLTGMRRGEILGLTWENVSLEQDVLYILQSKSGKPRELPIPSKLREVLLDLRPKATGLVFDLPLIMLQRYFASAMKEAGIFGCRFHDLRHTFASHFIMRTNDLPTLQRLLGHSTPTMTQRYAHLSKAHLASAVVAFESAIPVPDPCPLIKTPFAPSSLFAREVLVR